MRFKVLNLGCKVNRVESDDIAAQLLAKGALADDADPQVVIVNTCTVTGEAEKKTRKAVHGALREYPDAQIFVTGCAAAIDPQEFAGMDERVQVVGKSQVVQRAVDLFARETTVDAKTAARHDDAVSAADSFLPESAGTMELRCGDGFPTRVGIKVQDGCDNACTYCIVHVARGRARSLPLSDCLDEVCRLSSAGVREAVITGINLGSYRDDGADLTDLLLRMREAAPSMRLRASSIEPLDVDERFIDALASQDGWICRHLHLPLQSGSSRVLREMARPYDAEYFEDLVARIRTQVPQISLSTDIIVGFPGETDGDFEQTLEAVRRCRFSKIHVFRYSKRQGTPAAERSDQVDPHIIAQRAEQLQRLGHDLRAQEAQARVGTTERVLVESDGMGMTESYFPVRIRQQKPRGSLVECTLTEPSKDGIFSL